MSVTNTIMISQTKKGYYHYLSKTMAILSATSGLIFLSQSSFFKLQLKNKTPATEALFFAALSAILVFLVFAAPNWFHVLRKVRSFREFSANLAVLDCVFMAIVWLLSFLIKFPRFDLARGKSCSGGGSSDRDDTVYGLVSLGAFALFALLLSPERSSGAELGLSGVLLGLIMDASLETGPVFGYVLGSAVYCMALILLKHYCLEQQSKLRVRAYRNGPVFLSALIGTVFMFLSPFSERQFGDSANSKAVCFITFSFLLGCSLLRAREFINSLAVKCRERFLVKALVKIVLFAVVSVLIFANKYPRFRLRSELGEPCGERGVNRYDVFSAGSFSLFALTLSSEKEQPVKLGFFSFLIGLTMDASIETLGSKHPSFVPVIFSSVYCASLILGKCYLDSLIDVWQKPEPERFFQEEDALIIECGAGEESDREIGKIVDNIREEEEEEEEVEEESGEKWTGFVNGRAQLHDEHGEQLLNRKERNRARRKGKAKREKGRIKEMRNQKEDLWISVV